MLIINFEGREVKGLSKGRYDETFAGEDGKDPAGTYDRCDQRRLRRACVLHNLVRVSLTNKV